ncbi:MAG: glycosyltransferase [Bacteroidia bacterium]|nr:glycosyltransferase [Bacteroidia bacterium]
MSKIEGKRVLVSVLNWGLGHASRSHAIISRLIERGVVVEIASDGPSLSYLRKSFPDLEYHQLPSYDIIYPRSGNISLAVVASLPSLLKSIKSENQKIKEIVVKGEYDLIISDNRYGCYDSDIRSIFVGHQLRILTPGNSSFIENMLLKVQGTFIKKFQECWIPDLAGQNNLSGRLSHDCQFLILTKYIGTLSRLKIANDNAINSQHILVVISGPEDQRTVFEELLIPRLKKIEHNVVLLRGLPHLDNSIRTEGNLTILNHCDPIKFADLIQSAILVISRSGYSTIMDLSKTNKKAFFIPTPGQTEQVYLAKYLSEKSICTWQEQGKIDLEVGIKNALSCEGFSAFDSSDLLDQAIDENLNIS